MFYPSVFYIIGFALTMILVSVAETMFRYAGTK